jgi:hypothetical protein
MPKIGQKRLEKWTYAHAMVSAEEAINDAASILKT